MTVVKCRDCYMLEKENERLWGELDRLLKAVEQMTAAGKELAPPEVKDGPVPNIYRSQ